MDHTKADPDTTKADFSPRTEVERAIWTICAAGGRLVPLKADGNPAWQRWNTARPLASETAIAYHREHGPGSLGVQPSSLNFCHIDVDSGLEDARRLAAAHLPMFGYVSRNGRGMHFGNAAPDTPMRDRDGVEWDGAVVDFKRTGMCRTPDEALCAIAGALIARADGVEVPVLPSSFIDAYHAAARRHEETDQPQPAPGSKAPPQAARVNGRGRRGTPLACQPSPASRIEDAEIGERNTTLYFRTLTKKGPHARHFSSYQAYEDQVLPVVFEAAHRMAVPEETNEKIVATIRSALGTAWKNQNRNRHGAVPISNCWSANDGTAYHRWDSQRGGESTARLRQADRDERHARIRAIDEATRTVAETAAAAGVSTSTVYRARRGARRTKTPIPPSHEAPMP